MKNFLLLFVLLPCFALAQVDKKIISSTKNLQLDSLITAARTDNGVLAKRLIDKGVDVNGKIQNRVNRDIWVSPLNEAVRTNRLDMVRLLVENGADPNLELAEIRTPFHESSGGCTSDIDADSYAIFELLLSKGGRPNTCNMYRKITPLHTAIEAGDLKKVTKLIESGAAINLADSLKGFHPPLITAVRQLRYDMVELLFKQGANVDATFTDGYEDCVTCPEKITALHMLATEYNESYHTDQDREKIDRILDLILAHKPDINIVSGFGQTPLDFAAFGNSTKLVDKLIKNGAKLETQTSTALHCAAAFSNVEMVAHLLKYKINVNKRNVEGYTPLHLSLTCCGDGFGAGITDVRRAKTIKLLLDHGADPTIRDRDGRSFIQIIKTDPRKDFVQMLIKQGILKPDVFKTEN